MKSFLTDFSEKRRKRVGNGRAFLPLSLTPALSRGERERRQSAGREYPSPSTAASADFGFSLSQRGRAGVRENGACGPKSSYILNDVNFKTVWLNLAGN
ncbi:MAG: hypothetical protein HYY24_25115 [Verrucomicrobia bacterium]|nr:hypothetical protein [Verrucomicrobiota bacterium]